MFTGIVEELGVVETLEQRSDSARLTVRGPHVLGETGLGDSIAVNGCCLTVTERDRETFTVDVMQETLDHTALAELRPGDRVNLERPVTVSGRLGGHLVQGHVDVTGTVVRRRPSEHWEVLTIEVPRRISGYLVPKGSVTVDGVSLTVADVQDGPPPRFTVSLVPETLARTTLGARQPGDRVNVEADLVGKYVERLLDRRAQHEQDRDG